MIALLVAAVLAGVSTIPGPIPQRRVEGRFGVEVYNDGGSWGITDKPVVSNGGVEVYNDGGSWGLYFDGGAPVTSVSGTAPIVSSGGATPAISIPCASASSSGAACLTNGVVTFDAGGTFLGELTIGANHGLGVGGPSPSFGRALINGGAASGTFGLGVNSAGAAGAIAAQGGVATTPLYLTAQDFVGTTGSTWADSSWHPLMARTGTVMQWITGARGCLGTGGIGCFDYGQDGGATFNVSVGVSTPSLETSVPIAVSSGGNGATTATGGGICYGDGTIRQVTAAGASGQCLLASTDGGVAPWWGNCPSSVAKYLVQTTDPSLPNAQAMGTLGTGLVKNATTTGVQSIYAGTSSCTAPTYALLSLDASGAGTCTSQINQSTYASTFLSDPADCAANNWAVGVTANGTATCSQPAFSNLSGTATDGQLASAYSGVGACAANTWASTLTRNAAPGCTQPGFANLSGSATDSQVPDNITITLAATATALAVDPTACGAGLAVTDIAANGTLTCADRVASVTASGNVASSGGTSPNITLTGTIPQTNGGTGAGPLTCFSYQRLTSDGTVQSCASTVTEVGATAPIVSTGGGSPTISCNEATDTTNGCWKRPPTCASGFLRWSGTAWTCATIPTCTGGSQVLQFTGTDFACVCLDNSGTTAC